MLHTDRKEFLEVWGQLVELFSPMKEPISEAKLEAYWLVLADWPVEAVVDGLRLAMRRCKYFPRPAEIIELIEGSETARAQLAWEVLDVAYQRAGYWDSVLFQDGALARTVKAVFGGWVQFSEQRRELSQEMLQARYKQFVATYARESRSPKEPMLLMGHHEITNLDTVVHWTRDQFEATYTQRLFVARGVDDSRFVEAVYDRSTARLASSQLELLEAARKPLQLPTARQPLQLAPAASEEARRLTPEEIQQNVRNFIASFRRG